MPALRPSPRRLAVEHHRRHIGIMAAVMLCLGISFLVLVVREAVWQNDYALVDVLRDRAKELLQG